MKYTSFLRCGAAVVQSPDNGKTAELEKIIRDHEAEIRNLKNQLVSTEAAHTNTIVTGIRSDSEVDEIVEILQHCEREYFNDIPLDSIPIPMLKNLPGSLIKAIRFVWDRKEYHDILNPIMALYLCCADDPAAAIGRYWQLIHGLINDNAQAIDDDARQYLSMIGDEQPFDTVDPAEYEIGPTEDEEDDRDVPDDDYDESEEDDYEELDDVDIMSPGEYVEIDNEAALEEQDIVNVDEEDIRDVES